MNEMKILSWNVNGIRAAARKGFLDWLSLTDPDVVCLQETKAQPDQLDEQLRNPAGYHSYWASAERKGYSGVGLLSREPPGSVELGIGIEAYDQEGRTIIADYGVFALITSYVPNGGRDHSRVSFKMEYKAALLEKCNQLGQAGKPVVFCGDINTAHKEIDLARPKSNAGSTGFLPIERAWIDRVVAEGYVDSYRALYPDSEGAYTWWAYWGPGRKQNVGWRLDYFFVSPDLRDRIHKAEIHPDVLGSDHCPVSLVLDL